MDALALRVEHMCINLNTVAAVSSDCEISGTKGHQSAERSLLNETHYEKVNYTQGNPYSNTYNPGWRNHPNFSYKNNNPIQNTAPPRQQGYQAPRTNQPMQPVPPNPSFEEIVKDFIVAQKQKNKEFMNQSVHVNELITQLGTKVDQIITHNKMLETQISQVALNQAPQTTPGG
jgi:hypothetical protein